MAGLIVDKTEMENFILTYYQAIKDGTIIVGKWIKLLYERIVSGLESKEYVFDVKKANNAITWIEKHAHHTEGILAPGLLELELWQKAFLSIVFGVCDPKTGLRQFREIVLVVARKNGKSLFASAIANYEFFIDGGYGARIYCLAPKLDQAEIIYNDIWTQILLEDELRWDKDNQSKKNVAKHRMTDLFIPDTNSTVKKIAFSAKKSDGFNPSLTICDEIASWAGDQGLKQYEVMKSGMGARPEGLLLSCSTAGYINDSIYDELFKRATRFLLGDSQEKRLLPFLYTIDDPEKWDDINELAKSNPNLGVSVSVDYLLEEIAVAYGSLSKKAEFLTKYCNIKQSSSQAWFEYQTVENAMGEPLRLEDFNNCYCVGGVDLSMSTDLTSCCIVIEKGGLLHVISHFFMPLARMEDATQEDGVAYQAYVQRGILTLSGENIIDYHDVYKWFTDLIEKYHIYPLQVGYDRYSAQYFVKEMEQYGFHMDDVKQGFNLTGTIRVTDGAMKDGKFRLGDNSLLQMHLLNTALKNDATLQKLMIDKLAKTLRIDGCAALLDAMCMRQKWYTEIGGQLKNEGK